MLESISRPARVKFHCPTIRGLSLVGEPSSRPIRARAASYILAKSPSATHCPELVGMDRLKIQPSQGSTKWQHSYQRHGRSHKDQHMSSAPLSRHLGIAAVNGHVSIHGRPLSPYTIYIQVFDSSSPYTFKFSIYIQVFYASSQETLKFSINSQVFCSDFNSIFLYFPPMGL